MISIVEYTLNKKKELKEKIESYRNNIKLVIVQVNDDPASNAYIKGKINDLNEIEVRYELLKLSPAIKESELIKVIERLNNDSSVTGFIVQLPLPKHINKEKIMSLINPLKDVDGFHPLSKFIPATPKGILTFLEDLNYEFKGKNAVILGRSEIVGKPMASALISKDMNVTVLHSKTSDEDRKFYIEHADLIVVAVGKPLFIKNEYNFKKDAFVFDVGINRVNDHLVGDCLNNLDVKFQSPVPKGVGLLTRLALLINLVEAYNNGF